jgi:protocatechuate 3,4-dioxygenase beta subunit
MGSIAHAATPAGRTLVVSLVVTLAFAALLAPASAQDPAHEVWGRVLEEFDVPVFNATVTFVAADGSRAGHTGTDEQGRFRFSDVAGPAKYTLEVAHPCCRDAEQTVYVDETFPAEGLEVWLRPIEEPRSDETALLHGVVTDRSTGEPLADVSVEVSNEFSAEWDGGSGDDYRCCPGYQSFFAITDENGAYEVRVNQGRVHVWIDVEGYDHGRGDFAISEDRRLDIALPPSAPAPATVAGIVKDTDGEPLRFAGVSISPDWRCQGDANSHCVRPEVRYYNETGANEGGMLFEPRRYDWSHGETDEEGRFELPTEDGALLVEAWHAGYVGSPVPISVEAGGTAQVEVVLEKMPPESVRIQGRVVDAVDGTPVGFADVSVSNPRWGSGNHTRTAEDGTFALQTRPGYTILEVSAWESYFVPCAEPTTAFDGNRTSWRECGEQGQRPFGYQTHALVLRPEADSTHQLAIALNRAVRERGAIEGSVLDAATGSPVADAHVGFENFGYSDWQSTQTAADGRFRLDVAAGYGLIRIDANGYYPYPVSVEVEPGATTRVDVALEPGEVRNGGGYGYYRGPYGAPPPPHLEMRAAGGDMGMQVPMPMPTAMTSIGASPVTEDTLDATSDADRSLGDPGEAGTASDVEQDPVGGDGEAAPEAMPVPAAGLGIAAAVALAAALVALGARRRL